MTPTRTEFLFFSTGEKALFYLLIFGSLFYMGWQIYSRVQLWKKGKPLGSVREGVAYWIPTREALGRWWGNVAVYVLAQKKVRSSRKKSGAPMHLLIFYGFLTLFIGTTLLAINTYSPFKFHHGLYYLIYEITLDVMGLAYTVGIVWAWVRRAKMPVAGQESSVKKQESSQRSPFEIDENSQIQRQAREHRRQPITDTLNDHVTLGLLLLLGINGFLLEAARIAVTRFYDLSGHLRTTPISPWFDSYSPVGNALSSVMSWMSPLAYKGVWWFHIATVVVFFAVIPKMRLRHIVMAIFSVAGKPGQAMGELRPISIEEVELTGQIGVAEAKDYSRWHLMSLDACMECGRCTEVCPAWNVGKVLNPKQVVQDIRGAMVSGTSVAEAVSEEALWQCTTCNACVEACPVLIRHVDLIVDARRHLVAEGKFSGTGATMLRQVGSASNAWGSPASSREDWMKGLEIPLCRDGNSFEYLFWVGCAGATDPGAIKTTKSVASLLTKAGVSFACLGQEEACTGDPARRVGDEFLFQEKAQTNVSVFQKYGVKKIVTHCPHCLNTFKNEYGQFEGDVEVVHHTELLQQLVGAGKLKAASGDGVVYHDPCYLARVNGISDAPRAIVPTTLEAPNHGVKTRCCGAGGGRMWMEEPPNERPGNKRAEELLATGAKTVALGCPFCRIMLDASIKQVTDEEIRLVDLAEMLSEANA